MVDARAICDACGHTRDWHDRDAERVRRGSDPPVERPCYREIGGAACGCSGFRESGTFAMRPGFTVLRTPAPDWTSPRVALLVLLLVLLGLALLYAYRSQTPSIPQVSITQAVQDITAGRVNAVSVAGNRSTLQFRDAYLIKNLRRSRSRTPSSRGLFRTTTRPTLRARSHSCTSRTASPSALLGRSS